MNFVFAPRLVPTLLTALMLVVLIGLGTWQIQRLQWKENLIATIEARRNLPPSDVMTLDGSADNDYRPAKASGSYHYDHEMYVYALSREGVGGYHVLTPLELSGGPYLLVDRGWIPYDKRPKRDGPPEYMRPVGLVHVSGTLKMPHSFWLQPSNQPALNDWYGTDLAAMAKYAKVQSFMPFVLESDALSEKGYYPRGGQTRFELPNNHLEYAVTWYGLAVILLVIYGVSTFRKVAAN